MQCTHPQPRHPLPTSPTEASGEASQHRLGKMVEAGVFPAHRPEAPGNRLGAFGNPTEAFANPTKDFLRQPK